MIATSEIKKVKNSLLSKVKNEMQQRYKLQDNDLPLRFLELFWEQVQLSDWEAREIADIAGCGYTLWNFLKSPPSVKNAVSGSKVQVCNPTLDEHGWLCKGTVVLVRQKDTPFLVDSLRLELNRQSIPLHVIKSTVIDIKRDDKGLCVDLQPTVSSEKAAHFQQEAVVYLEVGLIVNEGELRSLEKAVKSVLLDVNAVVDDYHPMLAALDGLAENLGKSKDTARVTECLEMLSWLRDSHFTFLGCQQFDLNDDGNLVISEGDQARLGLFNPDVEGGVRHGGPNTGVLKGADFFYESDDIVAFSKSATRSTVHRPVYPDYIVFKRFDDQGDVVGESRFLGLFTFSVYSMSPSEIPILRQRVDMIMKRSGLLPGSHDAKNLLRVIESFPRDELFQSNFDTLYDMVMGVASISERRVVKLFMREDSFGKFVNCVVYVPRDIYSTRIRIKIEEIVGNALGTSDFDSTTHFSESILARAHVVFKLGSGEVPNFDQDALEAEIIEVTKGWSDRFESALIESFGEAQGVKYLRDYANAFSISYQENFDARTTITDIKMLETLETERSIAMHLFHTVGSDDNGMRFKVMKLHSSLELSDVIPILEHLGLRVLGEHPYKINRPDGVQVWMHDFSLAFRLPVELDVHAVSKLFEEAFAAVWYKKADSDAFNRLVLGARLSWREVFMLRAYSCYMKQTAFSFTQDYIANTLASQPDLTRNLVALFKAYFDPRLNDGKTKSGERIKRLSEKIEQGLDALESLDDDKILRRYYDFIKGTLRTNFFKPANGDNELATVSFKFNPKSIDNIPEPRPEFEIFVYSPRVEGVHLRGAKVARGGLRWSDRLQDYRTEVLGLVKAQQVKNSVIVPSGAKGGFVAKLLSECTTRDEIQAEGIECYKLFIRGLLELTDNYVAGKLVPPKSVVCRDEPDPYLVVAADKGTATFSDIANALSLEYKHWLGDAFASGGSVGYDHKKMGITARGAWVSVQRHFRELGIDVQSQNFTVVGIGDMSGDVFGNGMLLSDCIELVAGFNHLHIFIDPNPDVKASFKERQRLFKLPRSSWSDYQQDLISKGGGIFSRTQKFIVITPEMKERFEIEADKLSPSELISELLKAPIDLLWNGGIGTYVKSSRESHSDVGDKANDGLRVNGDQLRCKVIGEGGNLGFTQLGRIEFALNGGACNTDFIDNAAGVDCSDHEVNIKILLDEMIASGDLTTKQRNLLLEEMTGAVSELVLDNNYRQTAALSLAQYQVSARMGEYKRFIQYLEAQGWLNRSLEFLPDEEQLADRESKSQPLTRPELSVLLSYAKVMLKSLFISENIAQEPVLEQYVETAFPSVLVKRYGDKVHQHRLKREIVATQCANDLINSLGITAMHRLVSGTGATVNEIALAFAAAKNVFKLEEFQTFLETLDNRIDEQQQLKMSANMARRVRRATRWFLVRNRSGLNPVELMDFTRNGISELNPIMGKTLLGSAAENWSARCEKFRALSINESWVLQLAMPDNLFSGLSVVEVARASECNIEKSARVFFYLYNELNLEWFATQLSEVTVQSYWQAIARETFLDELEVQMRKLASSILEVLGSCDEQDDIHAAIEEWLAQKSLWVKRWLGMVKEVQHAKVADFAMFSVALRELNELAQSCEEPR